VPSAKSAQTTFGRIFHDITGRSPSAMRLVAQANMSELNRVPACVLKAAQRPDLTIAVLEKRRRIAKDTLRQSIKEVFASGVKLRLTNEVLRGTWEALRD
jgi:hypothetical protein